MKTHTRARMGMTGLLALALTALAGFTAAPASAATCSATASNPVFVSLSNTISWQGSGSCSTGATFIAGALQRQGTLNYVPIDTSYRYDNGIVSGYGNCNGTTSTYRTRVYAEDSKNKIGTEKFSTARGISCR